MRHCHAFFLSYVKTVCICVRPSMTMCWQFRGAQDTLKAFRAQFILRIYVTYGGLHQQYRIDKTVSTRRSTAAIQPRYPKLTTRKLHYYYIYDMVCISGMLLEDLPILDGSTTSKRTNLPLAGCTFP